MRSRYPGWACGTHQKLCGNYRDSEVCHYYALLLVRAGSLENANSPKMSAEADNPFGMHSYEKRLRRFFRMPCYKFIGLKIPWNQGFMAIRRCRSALALACARNSFGMRTCPPSAGSCKPFGIRTYEIIRPEVL